MTRRAAWKKRGEGPLRIANCSGFYGDRLAAAREMLEGGPIDFLTGDYLAELTMLILWKGRQRDPSAGYAATFLRQMEDVLGLCIEKGVRVVVNAGGLNPAGLAAKLRELAAKTGVDASSKPTTGMLNPGTFSPTGSLGCTHRSTKPRTSTLVPASRSTHSARRSLSARRTTI